MNVDHVPRIFPLGNGALTVEFGRSISVELNESAIALAEYFDKHPFAGYVESVPAYASTTIFFDVLVVRRSFACRSAFETIKDLVESALPFLSRATNIDSRRIEIPVSFGADAAPDLQIVAEMNRMTPDEVVNIFLSADYRVYMIGFLPGFAYMGEVDEKIAIPRKDSPRLKVPKGSVGIAGRQTGIYPFDSPGGWQIIGHTDVPLFEPGNRLPCLLEAGDTVRFVDIGR